VARVYRQRPERNGSSNTTFDILVALTVLGASALSVLAVLRSGRERPDDDAPSAEEDERDDE
jgi:hypothetical protein